MAILHDVAGNPLNTLKVPDQHVTLLGTAALAATLTIPAAPAGQYIYIAHMRWVRAGSAAITPTAVLAAITSTGLNGNPAWSVSNGLPNGMSIDLDQDFLPPLRAAATGTNVTFVFPAAGAGVQWSCWAVYFYGV